MVPSWRILQRADLSPWWSLFSLFPLGTIPDLRIVAFEDGQRGSKVRETEWPGPLARLYTLNIPGVTVYTHARAFEGAFA